MNQAELLDAVRKARSASNPELIKAWVQPGNATSGLAAYDLQAPSLTLFPVLSPLRNMIPRVGGFGGVQANWRAVTGINTSNLSVAVAQGQRNAAITSTTANYSAAFTGIGLEDYVTFEAQYAGQGFEDIKARATRDLLMATMIGEESVLLGGNSSNGLGVTPTPAVADVLTGGTLLPNTQYSVIAVALGYDSYWAQAGLNNGYTGTTFNVTNAVIQGQITRTNVDGSQATYGSGTAQKSVNGTRTTANDGNSTHALTATVAAVPGAAGFAWFWGAAGSEVLGALTTVNALTITANATGSQTAASLPAADNSTNQYEFDGLITQISKAGSGAYYNSLNGGTLTSDDAGGIVEIDAAFSNFWNLSRLSPKIIWCNSQQLIEMNKLVIGGGGAPLYRYNLDGSDPGVINAGAVIGSYLNKITNEKVRVLVHPTMPPGTLMFYSPEIPYPLSGVGNVLQVLTRQDYYQIEWPLRTRKWEYGVYADEVLQNYFPPAFGLIQNIN